jgi:hypothetical protein
LGVLSGRTTFSPFEGGRCEKIKKWEIFLINSRFTHFFKASGRKGNFCGFSKDYTVTTHQVKNQEAIFLALP